MILHQKTNFLYRKPINPGKQFIEKAGRDMGSKSLMAAPLWAAKYHN
jgi:hypothetical protein